MVFLFKWVLLNIMISKIYIKWNENIQNIFIHCAISSCSANRIKEHLKKYTKTYREYSYTEIDKV